MAIVPERPSASVDSRLPGWHDKRVTKKAPSSAKKSRTRNGKSPSKSEALARKRAGKAILRAIEAKGYTISTFAAKLKCEISTIWRYCEGLRFPERPMLRKLRDELGISIDALM